MCCNKELYCRVLGWTKQNPVYTTSSTKMMLSPLFINLERLVVVLLTTVAFLLAIVRCFTLFKHRPEFSCSLYFLKT